MSAQVERIQNSMKNRNLFLVIGQFSLAGSIILDHFVQESPFISFLIGFFIGLSVVANVAFILGLRTEKRHA